MGFLSIPAVAWAIFGGTTLVLGVVALVLGRRRGQRLPTARQCVLAVVGLAVLTTLEVCCWLLLFLLMERVKGGG